MTFYTALRLLLLVVTLTTTAARADDDPILSDRPGNTDSPRAAAPGHIRVEAGIYNFARDRNLGTRTTRQTYGTLFLIDGLAHNSEIQVGYDGVSHLQSVDEQGVRTARLSSGGETLRYKLNLIGNREGRFALAILPRIQKAEGLDGEAWQGSVGLPLAFDLTEKISISLTPEWLIETNSETARRAHGAYSGVGLAYEIDHRWSVFAQNSVHTQSIRDGWGVTAGAGVTYRASKKMQLDLTTDFGLTRAADDFNLQTGFTYVL